MLYDLNVLYPENNNSNEILKTLAVLRDLGYNVIALTVIIAGKLPKNYTNPISKDVESIRAKFPELKILTRATVLLDDSSQHPNLSPLRPLFDLIAVRPMSEKLLQNCTNLDPDLISFPATKRLPYFLRHKTICAAVDKGVRVEIGYSASTSEGRKHVISNASGLIRASRSRGIVISSETDNCLNVRGPYDVTNMAVLWGLDHMRARNAVGKEPGLVVRGAELRKNSYKQTVELVE